VCGRGLKLGENVNPLKENTVARRVRAWIETADCTPNPPEEKVARRVRAWIETARKSAGY